MDIRQSALMIRDAVDRWEVDGDDERLVNEVIDPWIRTVINSTGGEPKVAEPCWAEERHFEYGSCTVCGFVAS
jgi:hypothetical protein